MLFIIISWRKIIIIEKILVVQLINIIHDFYGDKRVIAVFTGVRH
jgi:hypothetical protein